MPASRNKRKNGKRKQHTPNHDRVVKLNKLTAEQQINKLYGDKRPYCKVCGVDAILASDDEVSMYKQYDTTYNLDFIYIPQCECYKTNTEWMDIR